MGSPDIEAVGDSKALGPDTRTDSHAEGAVEHIVLNLTEEDACSPDYYGGIQLIYL